MARPALRGLMHEHRITVGGRTLNVDVAEDPDNGPPVVLLHGQAARWQDFRRVLPALTKQHRVIAIEVPGYGASEHLGHDD